MAQPGPQLAEWLFARGHYDVGAAVQVTESQMHGAQLAFIFWQWQIFCTTIEVALKAFLLSQPAFATTEQNARRIFQRQLKHNLRDLLDECNQQELSQIVPLSKDEEALIDEFNGPFNKRAWIYAEKRGYSSFSNPIALKRVAHKLLVGIHPLCDPSGRAHEVPDP